MFKALALSSLRIPVLSKTTKHRSLSFWFRAFLVAANIVLLMSYIYGVNEYASKGYEIKALQKRLESLNEENIKINLKISEASSMVSIYSDFLSANFVPAGSPKFLEIPGTTQVSQR